MMHHPNMHHQPMSGHPPQHLPAHQGMPGHHQMPPHQMHRENRVPLGPSQAGGGMGAHGHGQALGGLGGMPVPHHAQQRPPHPIRAMPHHPPAQHMSVPQQMKPVRRGYLGGGYGGAVLPPPYAQPEPSAQTQRTGLCRPTSPIISPPTKINSDFVVSSPSNPALPASSASPGEGRAEETRCGGGGGAGADAAAGDSEAPRPPPPANSKEKTPMCLVNELARYNKIKHQYRLTSETGPAHKKVFTVTLRLGEAEEYTAEGSSIKRAQHAAASAALSATSYTPPPPRALPPHAAPHHLHRHSGAVMPTVELNALAMKLCQPAVYTSVPPVPATARARARLPPPYRLPPVLPYPRMLTPDLIYRVRVCVGGRAWLGEGPSPQAARHDAAARALQELRPPPDHPPAAPAEGDSGDAGADILNSEVKSPVSLVHELALKRNLSVLFTVKSERGPPHMRVFITACTVGDMETEGEGNGKKVSKRRAAERMLDEMKRRWPPQMLRARPHLDKRKPQPTKKKPRNLIKEGGVSSGEVGGADNPISRLAVARHAVRARSPQYRVIEERGAARRREFLVQCDAPPHCATGLGPNKKTAKRRAAHNVLLAMEMANSNETPITSSTNNADISPAPSTDANKNNGDTKRKESEAASAGGANSEVRQPVPGVLLMDYHQRSGQPAQPNGVSETSATGGAGAGGSSPGAKDQLMYLAQLLGFSVQFSDFPKRNHGEYLSLVSLSTEPPVMCHGGGPSTAHSHEQCARAALRALALMGLDAPCATVPAAGGAGAGAGGAASGGALSNGLPE